MLVYKKGIRSGSREHPEGVVFKFPADIEKFRDAKVLLVPRDGGVLFPMQVGVCSKGKTERTFFLENEFDNFLSFYKKEKEISSDVSLCVMGASSDEEHELFVKKIRNAGIPYVVKENIYEPVPKNEIKFSVEGFITSDMRRCITKIAINFLAFKYSPEFVLKKEFDDARNFVLGGDEKKEGMVFIDEGGKIFVGDTSKISANPDSILIVSENIEQGLQCRLEFYGLFTYVVKISNIKLPSKEVGMCFKRGHRPIDLHLRSHILIATYNEKGKLVII